MQFLLGALLAVAFFCCLLYGYSLGRRHKPPTTVETVLDQDAEEQREKAKKLRKGFDEMMAYNETKATKG